MSENSSYYDEEYFDGNKKRDTSKCGDERIREKMRRMAGFLAPTFKPDVVLDLGCAKGWLAEELGKHGVSGVFGTDISTYALTEAAKRSVGLTALSDVSGCGIPFRSSSFDLVVALDILEHLQRPDFALDEIHRVLKKRGGLFLSVPGPLSPNAFADPSHLNIWTYSEWKKLLLECGFYCRPVFHYQLYFSYDVPRGGVRKAKYFVRKARFFSKNRIRAINSWHKDDYLILALKR